MVIADDGARAIAVRERAPDGLEPVGEAITQRADARHVGRPELVRDAQRRGHADGAGDVHGAGSQPALLPTPDRTRFDGVAAEALLVALDYEGVCAAAGSSCASGAAEPSHVLLAMGLTRDDARAAVRFSLGATSTDADVDRALHVVPRAVEQLRSRALQSRAPALR
jgi:cysteine desulfurase